MSAKRSEMLAPLSDLVRECGETKSTRKNKFKKRPWHWDSTHQTAFDNVKTTIAKEVVLAYPDFTKPVDIYVNPRMRTTSLRNVSPYLQNFLPYSPYAYGDSPYAYGDQFVMCQ